MIHLLKKMQMQKYFLDNALIQDMYVLKKTCKQTFKLHVCRYIWTLRLHGLVLQKVGK